MYLHLASAAYTVLKWQQCVSPVSVQVINARDEKNQHVIFDSRESEREQKQNIL